MRVVIDVNVWISGFLWGGVIGQILRIARAQEVVSYVSVELLEELEITLQRPKFNARLTQRNQTAGSLLAITATISQFVEITAISVADLRDPDDAAIIATAVAAQAEALITGDLDLLALKSIQGIPVLQPNQFLKNLQ